MPIEVWKKREFDDTLLRLCNAVYEQNTIEKWQKHCILSFPQEVDLGIIKNFKAKV